MKKTYEKPIVELVAFNYADVVAASGPVSTWTIGDDTEATDTADWTPPVSVSVPDPVSVSVPDPVTDSVTDSISDFVSDDN